MAHIGSSGDHTTLDGALPTITDQLRARAHEFVALWDFLDL
jgi:hypothetical protein